MSDTPVEIPSLSSRLRAETSDVHERLEGTLDVMRPDLTRERYAEILARWLGFHRTWQQLGDRLLTGELGQFFTTRHKLQFLRDDLNVLGVDAPAQQRLSVVEERAIAFESPAAMLGGIYVIEGSTLGGQYIARHIKKTLGLTPDRGVAFFSSYGEKIGPRWRETKALLDTHSEQADIIIPAARRTFELLERWLNTT